MSFATQVQAGFTRVGAEIKALRALVNGKIVVLAPGDPVPAGPYTDGVLYVEAEPVVAP